MHDALVSQEIIDVAGQAEKFYVGKRGGRLSIPQGDINSLLVKLAREGRKVVRLKGGHPYVFGRGGEETLALIEHGIPYRVLPGVTSAFGGLTSAGIPATMRGINGVFEARRVQPSDNFTKKKRVSAPGKRRRTG